jgi:PAS domain S-box-containing protein
MNDNGKTKEQLIQELEDLRPRIAELEKTETEYQQAEETMQGQIKELDCFYNISALLELPGITLDEIMKRTVMLLPPAWQFPEITTACIVLEGQAFQTEHFRETSWMQTREIIVHGKPVGQVEVCYLEERLARDEGPFLKEERKLLNAITERLGHIIERIKAEETLRESEEKYRSLVENISDVIFDVDHQGVVLYFSPLGKDIWGYNREDVIGKNFIELIHPDDRDLLLQRFVELSDGVEKPLSYRFKDKAGNFRWVRSNTKPRIENGIFVGASGTLIDITKQKEEEALLMESEKNIVNSVLSMTSPSFTIPGIFTFNLKSN